ncbi:MAG: DUF6089 family protein [Fluviicola sp.]
MKKNLLYFFLLFSAISWAQGSSQHNNLSRSEIGLMGGGSFYFGDLNSVPFKNTNAAGQLYYRYYIHSRLSFRANLTYGFIQGYDSQSKFEIDKNRNLSFETSLWELGSGLEISYFPYEIGGRKYRSTGYLFAELALTRINPKAEFNGDMIELQPLGTEGQGSSLSDRNRYSKVQLAVPIGFGYRLTLTQNIALNFEYGIRFLFTDYLDDVGSGSYVDQAQLANANGPLSAELSNRSLDGNRFGQRGDVTSRDWYSFFGAGLSFRLGRKNSCPSSF